MTTTRAAAVTTPGKGRRRRPFRPPVVAAVAALVVAVAIVALLLWAIWFFEGSQHTSGGLAVLVWAFEVLVAIAALAVPVSAALGVRAAMSSATLAKHGNIPDARVAADDVRQWRLYVIGFGLAALILAFLFWF